LLLLLLLPFLSLLPLLLLLPFLLSLRLPMFLLLLLPSGDGSNDAGVGVSR
jgi:hypothetical protein